jgi:RNA polymerase sigma-70 factor (ECF subfamily)
MHHPHVPVALVVAPDPHEISDPELASALVAGRAWAIGETWHRFAPAVIMLARRALGSESEADDLAQEVFQRVFARARTLRAPDRLRSFIFSFAIRLLKTELRSRKARAWLSFQQPETLVDFGGERTDMESRDLLRQFYALLDRLAPRHRLVFVLRHLESMTLDEVAAHMDLSLSTVKRLLERATAKLSRWVESDPGLAGFLDGARWKNR